MDAKRLAEIKGWMTYERELYTRFVLEKNATGLLLVRARVFFMCMRDLPDLLKAVEDKIVPKKKPARRAKKK
jgi:hypothetical protein